MTSLNLILANPAVTLAVLVVLALVFYPYDKATDCVVCDGVGCEFCPRVDS
jgi:hypothetical protein